MEIDFVGRGYPIYDSGGFYMTAFFVGSREDAEAYARSLSEASSRNSVVPEEYTVGKSVAVYSKGNK